MNGLRAIEKHGGVACPFLPAGKRGQILFFVWVDSSEQKWVILAERRGGYPESDVPIRFVSALLCGTSGAETASNRWAICESGRAMRKALKVIGWCTGISGESSSSTRRFGERTLRSMGGSVLRVPSTCTGTVSAACWCVVIGKRRSCIRLHFQIQNPTCQMGPSGNA